VLAGHIAVAIETPRSMNRWRRRCGSGPGSIEEARTFAEAANKAKTDFLSNMSHELRTPLNAIIGFSEVLRDGASGPLTPDQEVYLKDIWESGKHLQRIINNILDLSKIEAGMMELDLDDFYLKELLEGSLSLFRDKAKKQELTLAAEIGDEIDLVRADKTKIKQVAMNLIANAVKFARAGA
jgi:signal transduction histidine kinase